MGRGGASIHSARRRYGARENLERLHPYHSELMSSTNRPREADHEEQPPLGGWPRLYAIVIGELVLLVLLFTLFARAFR